MTSSLVDNITALSDIVAGQLALAVDLEEVLRAKRDCLVAHKLEELQRLSERELSLAQELGRLDTQRTDAAAGLATQLGLDPGATSSRLLAALPQQPEREQLALLLKTLGARLHVMNGLNEDNRILASNLLQYTGMVLRLLAHGPGGASYSASGRLSDGAPRPMLDDRI